jgi:uncharacterized membrane protein
MRSIPPVFYFIAGIVASAAAQMLLKSGSKYKVLKFEWIAFLIISGLFYLVSFIAYYQALRFFDISKLSPIMMGSVCLLIFIYGFFIGENITLLRMSGGILIIIGIYIISRT